MGLISFAFRYYKYQILFAVLIFGGIFWIARSNEVFRNDISWLDPILGISTFLFAGFLWLNGIRSQWENSLEKRLTAYFKFEGRTVLAFQNIQLLHEGDSRAWAQQVARQKTGQKDLDFEPYFKYKDLGVGFDRLGRPIKCYEITLFFSSIPSSIQEELGYLTQGAPKKMIKWTQVEHVNVSVTMEKQVLESPA